MSREIKFRVWDEDGKLIGFNRFEKGRWECQMLRTAGGSGEWSNGVLHGPHMDQYTGRKDKNGVEIYEGDIISNGARGQQYPIGWNTNLACWDVERSAIDLAGGLPEKRYAVIGNIYENGELLSPEGGK
jgi:hypothetical protein